MRRRAWAAFAALILGVVPLTTRAATPAEGTIDAGHPSVAWTGGPLLISGAKVLGLGAPDREDQNVSTFTLHIALPPGYFASRPLGAVRIRVEFPSTSDLDITVSGKGFARTSNLRGGDHDQITLLRPKNGDYMVLIRAYKPLNGTFQASAHVIALKQGARPRTTRSSPVFSSNVIVDPDGANTGEPNVEVDSKGRVFVVAPGQGVNVWRSDNSGKSFKHLGDFDTDSRDGGGGDAEVKLDRNDNVYIADLAVATINVQRSTDHGKSFGPQTYTGYEADRQWLATYGDKTVYLGYHDFTAEDEIVFRSDDAGATFTHVSSPIVDPVVAATCIPNTFSGPIGVDQKDETVYIAWACSDPQSNATSATPPYGNATGIYVGVSKDRGVTWTDHKVVQYPVGASIANLFPSMSLDQGGNIYASWAGRTSATGLADAYVSVSKDHGQTWSEPIKVNKDSGTHFMSWVTGGKAGRSDVAFIGTSATSPDDLNAVWNVDLSQSFNTTSAHPTFTQTRVSDHPIHIGQVCVIGILCSLGGDRTLLDFIGAAIDRNGFTHVVWTENAGGARHLGYAQQVPRTAHR